MKRSDLEQMRNLVESIYRTESRKVMATLIRLLGDFELAEDAMQEAFNAALTQWGTDGVPENPQSWLISAGRFKGIDALRKRSRLEEAHRTLVEEQGEASLEVPGMEEDSIHDDMLRLIFTCCHPALAPEARVALTLREVCGLTTEEIARAFLVTTSSLAQRIVRAKAKIRNARIPYRVPSRRELPDRLDAVLHSVYLVYNEGYSASSGDMLTRPDISGEAIRLGRLLLELLPEGEVMGLLGLMLLQESRREARTTEEGDIVLLEDQDRSKWQQEYIAEGLALVDRAIRTGHVGPYTVHAAIASEHSRADRPSATDWKRIVAWYDILLDLEQSPVVELNRAVAIAMHDGPEAGLELIDAILTRGELATYHLAHAARADMCRRLRRADEARASYNRALELARVEPERRFLKRRLSELG